MGKEEEDTEIWDLARPLKPRPKMTRTFNGRPFYLVQRLYPSPWAKEKDWYERPGVKVKSNPFGYGRMGDYELDYMGSAEFEWGAIPKANNRLAEAGDDLVLERHEFNGQNLIFLYIGKEGDPTTEFDKWVNEGCDGKEPAYDLRLRLTDPHKWMEDQARIEPQYRRTTEVWWSLLDNIIWSFVEEDGTSHLEKMLASMGEAPVEFLR